MSVVNNGISLIQSNTIRAKLKLSSQRLRVVFVILLFMQFSLICYGNRSDSGDTLRTYISRGRFYVKSDTALAFHYYQMALDISTRSNQIENVAVISYELAGQYAAVGNNDIAIRYFRQSAMLFEQINQFDRACKAYIAYGNLLNELSFFDASIDAFKNALALSEKNSNPFLIVDILIGTGKVYTRQGDIAKAMDNFVTALDISEKYNYQRGRADAWNQIGIVHWKEGKNREALNAYLKGFEIREQIGDSLGMAESLNNIGIIHKLENDFKTAEMLYANALAIRQRMKYAKGVGQTLFNIGSLKDQRGLYNEALQYYTQSLEIKFQLRDEYGKLACYLNMGGAYTQLKRLSEAEKSYLLGLKIAERIGAADYVKSFHRELSDLYALQYDYKNAWVHHVAYMAAKDTLINISNQATLAELQANYNFSESQRNIEKLRLEQMLAKEQLKRDRMIRNSLIVLIFMIILMTLGILNRSKVLRKKNNQLRKQQIIIEQREQEKENLLREMHHRVKNNLQLVSGMLNMQARKIEDVEAAQALLQARDRIYTIGQIHQKLYEQEGLSTINLKDYIPALCQDIVKSNVAEHSMLKLVETVDDIYVTVDMAISIGLIINEAILNSIKHAFGPNAGLIEVKVRKPQSDVILVVKDNGFGIGKIKDVEDFGGFGFQLMRLFARKLKGQLDVNGENGTEIRINIPL